MSDPLSGADPLTPRKAGWSAMTPEQKKVIAARAAAALKAKREFALQRDIQVSRTQAGLRISFLGGAWTAEQISTLLSKDFFTSVVKG